MEITPAPILTQKHIVKFLKIVDEHHFFKQAIPHIKQLATKSKIETKNQEWQKFFDNSTAMGELIECAYENYEKNRTYTTKTEMAIDFGTKGSYAWSKDFLLSHEGAWEKKLLSNEFLRAVEQNNRKRMSTLLNIGIDVNSTDQGPDEDGCCALIGGYRPALISAVKQLNFDLTTFLLEKNANPNILSLKQRTPLMIIIKKLHKAEQNKQYENFYKSFAILRLLVRHSALNISQIDSSGKQAIDYATEYKLDWLIKMFT